MATLASHARQAKATNPVAHPQAGVAGAAQVAKTAVCTRPTAQRHATAQPRAARSPRTLLGKQAPTWPADGTVVVCRHGGASA
eukprot:11995997-Alexandrium_andersonii.AAC.1